MERPENIQQLTRQLEKVKKQVDLLVDAAHAMLRDSAPPEDQKRSKAISITVKGKTRTVRTDRRKRYR